MTENNIVVLIVDDEEEFLASASRLLRRRCFEVYTASSGDAALELLRRTPVDLVVLDLKMPDVGGDEVFDRIRRSQPLLPVIMLTGHGSIPHAFQMSKDGVADYVAKPCDMDWLAARIHRVVKDARGRQTAAPRPAETVTVLLVDDEPELLSALARALERREIHAITETDGEAALATLAANDVDVVVLDVKMPGMDGIELLSRIRHDYPDRRVVLLSGHPTVPDAVRGLKAGAMEYLSKPPNVEQLAQLIHRGAGERRADLQAHHERLVRESLERQPD